MFKQNVYLARNQVDKCISYTKRDGDIYDKKQL